MLRDLSTLPGALLLLLGGAAAAAALKLVAGPLATAGLGLLYGGEGVVRMGVWAVRCVDSSVGCLINLCEGRQGWPFPPFVSLQAAGPSPRIP